MTKLSTTARAILTAAAERDDRIALAPERLPAAARRAVVLSLLKAGLLQEVAAEDDHPAWRMTEGGERCARRINDAGLGAIGAEATEAAHSGPQDAEPATAHRMPQRARSRHRVNRRPCADIAHSAST